MPRPAELAVDRFRRRWATRRRLVRGLIGLGLAALVAAGLLWLGLPTWPLLLATAAIVLTATLLPAAPPRIRVADRLDAEWQTHELLGTAVRLPASDNDWSLLIATQADHAAESNELPSPGRPPAWVLTLAAVGPIVLVAALLLRDPPLTLPTDRPGETWLAEAEVDPLADLPPPPEPPVAAPSPTATESGAQGQAEPPSDAPVEQPEATGEHATENRSAGGASAAGEGTDAGASDVTPPPDPTADEPAATVTEPEPDTDIPAAGTGGPAASEAEEGESGDGTVERETVDAPQANRLTPLPPDAPPAPADLRHVPAELRDLVRAYFSP